MSTIEQIHDGIGDNVAGDKIIYQVKSLAPADLMPPIDLVLESLRKKDTVTAMTQMGMLKAMAQREPESAALVEVISIYSGLAQIQDHTAAWMTVSKIISTATNDIVKDVCLAALLKLSSSTDREQVAKGMYAEMPSPGPYAREAYLRFYASEAQLEEAIKGIPTEGDLTGIIEGALRLELTDLLTRAAERLHTLYPSYNSKVLLTIAIGYELNSVLSLRHFWLNRPEVKERLDDLADQAVQLLEQSQGADARVNEFACSIFFIYLNDPPARLFETLKMYLQYLDPKHSATISRFKALVGDDAHLTPAQRDLNAAYTNSEKRTIWCRQFLAVSSHTIEEAAHFLQLATPTELEEWVSHERLIADDSEIAEAFIRLISSIPQQSDQDDILNRHRLSDEIDKFIDQWGDEIPTIPPHWVFQLAEKLFDFKLSHKALLFTSSFIPDEPLWPSPFVVTHLKCLLETGQNKTFDEVISRVKNAEESVTILSFLSMRAERVGDIDGALKLSDRMVEIAPDIPHVWYQACYLRERYLTLDEQQELHRRIPDSVLKYRSRETVAILTFLAKAGDFGRAEAIWVEWFIRAPRECAVDLVNFHFNSCLSPDPVVSPKLNLCTAAVRYEQEGNELTRLIVDDQQYSSECTLKSSSQLGQLLQLHSVGESFSIGMTTYKVLEHLPPYVACFQIALSLRNLHNDGSDCFAVLEMPSDPNEFMSVLKKKLALGSRRPELPNAGEVIPLYMRGKALYPNDAFKAALNCWVNVRIPKSQLCKVGETKPSAVVLDAYSICYLAVTNLAQQVLHTGVSFVLPVATKEMLDLFIAEILDENYMTLGVTDGGRLYRTTASDLREHEAHMLKALQLIQHNSSVAHPVVQDAQLEAYSIKEGIDSTVYDAMQLSSANGLPWFCMDEAFASLHHVNNHSIVNVEAVILRAVTRATFDFENMRHGLYLYAIGALPLALTYNEILSLADTPNNMADFILYQVIKNHGKQIFSGEERAEILLNAILKHTTGRFFHGSEFITLWPRYAPWITFTDHIFNHGLTIYLSCGEGSVEFRFAKAMDHMVRLIGFHEPLSEFIFNYFLRFARGHFMDIPFIIQSFASLQQEGATGA